MHVAKHSRSGEQIVVGNQRIRIIITVLFCLFSHEEIVDNNVVNLPGQIKHYNASCNYCHFHLYKTWYKNLHSNQIIYLTLFIFLFNYIYFSFIYTVLRVV